jgi:hypothetical protein
MTLRQSLLARCQRGYETPVGRIAQEWSLIFGEDAFETVSPEDFPMAVLDQVWRNTIDDSLKPQIFGNLFSLAAWCGFNITPQMHSLVGQDLRRVIYDCVRHVRVSGSTPRRPTVHALFTCKFRDPLHSPTRGVVDYGLALLSDPQVERVDIYHDGAVEPEMLDYLRQRLGDFGDRIHLVPLNLGQIGTVLERGPTMTHIWCDHAMAAHLSLLAALGPTIMFICADAPPYQYADVYWFFHNASYIAKSWAQKGVPDSFIANYMPCAQGPNTIIRRSEIRRSKAEFGLGDEDVLLVSVGNRLAVEIDRVFMNGVEAALRAHPSAVWLAVGQLPDNLLNACHTVLGRQFLHVPYERQLNSLLTACDIFINPFRAGGGDSAAQAMSNGAVVLTRGDFGDVAGLTPLAHHAADAEDYFLKLVDLIENPALRSAWSSVQSVHINALWDQAAFTLSLRHMADIAWDRYQQRVGQPIERLFALPARLAQNG